MVRKIHFLVMLAVSFLVVQAASAMSFNERSDIGKVPLMVQNQIERLYFELLKPLAMRLYEKIFLKIVKSLLSHDDEIIVYKGKKKPLMIGNINGKFRMEIM